MKRRKQDEAVRLDMNISLVSAAQRILHDHHVEDKLVAVLDQWPQGVDELLQDGGATTNDYHAIAMGYLRDAYQFTGDELTKETDAMIKQAQAEFRKNPKRFDDI
jgi:hypothetical protein